MKKELVTIQQRPNLRFLINEKMNGIPAMVVNAQHMKAVPGRKTDVTDSEWIADLVRHGLLRASYIPSREQRELRELVRYRKSLVEDRTGQHNYTVYIHFQAFAWGYHLFREYFIDPILHISLACAIIFLR